MTAVAFNHSLNKISSLASRFSNSLVPFFFVRNGSQHFACQHSNPTIKINRQMTPFLSSLPETARLAFWSSSQFENPTIANRTLKKSLIVNPFKTERLITSALKKGIKRMLVADIEEVAKIQNCYFKLRKSGTEVEQPQYIWNVQDPTDDLQNIKYLDECNLPFHGLHFGREMTMRQIQNFLENRVVRDKALENYRETTMQNVEQENRQLKSHSHSISPIITNYSQVDDYLMVCRVIGKDRLGNPVFENSCLDFICKADVCSCNGNNPPAKIRQMFDVEGQNWAVVRPARLDKLQSDQIQE